MFLVLFSVKEYSYYRNGLTSFHVNHRIQKPEKFCMWNPESWAWNPEYNSRTVEVLLKIGIRNPSSSDKDWNPEYTAWDSESKTVLDSLTWGN